MKVLLTRENSKEIALHVECIGDAHFAAKKPAAFILPGGPGADHTGYMRYVCLQDVCDLVFHDPRGCGQSDKANQASYTMDNYVEDVEEIRKTLKLPEIIVIGKSYGAMCALLYALRYPNHVKKLILSAGSPSNAFLDLAKEFINKNGTHEQIAVCEKLWTGQFKSTEDLREYFEITNPLYSVKARTEPAVDLERKSKSFSYEVLNEGFKNKFWGFNVVDQLSSLICKTLILAGDEDWITDKSLSRLMSEKIQRSRLIVFDHASHALEVDVTDKYFNSIREFIKEE